MDYAKIFAQNLPMEEGVIAATKKENESKKVTLTKEQRKVLKKYSDALNRDSIIKETFSDISPKNTLKKVDNGVTVKLSWYEMEEDFQNMLKSSKADASKVLNDSVSVAVTGIQTKGEGAPIVYVSQIKAVKINKRNEVTSALVSMLKERDYTRIPARITGIDISNRCIGLDIGDYGIKGVIRFDGWEGEDITEENSKELIGKVCHVSVVGRYSTEAGVDNEMLARAFKCITKAPKASPYDGLDRRYPVGSTIVGTVKAIEDKVCWARIEGEEVDIMLFFPWDRDGDFEWDRVVTEVTCGHTYSILVSKNEPAKKLLRGRILHELPDRINKELEQKMLEDTVKSRRRQIFNISPTDRNWGLPERV